MKIYDLLSGSEVPDIRVEMSGSDILYIGLIPLHNNDNAEGLILKFTWSGDNLARLEKLQGTWTNRAALGWA